LERLTELHPTDLEVLLAKYPGDKVADFCTHIRKAVNEKPWTLVSYAWCFYMAVFSGGRWIRAGLLRAGPDFWEAGREDETASALPLQESGLSFWHFPGQFDGEDIKLEFKTHLAAAEALFTPDQRVDIIEEAKNIFGLCAILVEELDDMVGSDGVETVSHNDVAGSKNESSPEKSGLVADAKRILHPADLGKPTGHISRFVRKPEVTGTLVALACLACVSLWRLQ
jgi:heme oxygenase